MRDTCGTLRGPGYVACTSRQLKKQPVSRTVLEDELVVWRHPAAGAVDTFRNR